MNWDNLRYFLTIARTGSARATAAELKVDQATVARRLQKLEKEMGILLFKRYPEGYTLTEAGLALLPEVKAMELATLNMTHKLNSIDPMLSGPIHIATTDVLAHYFTLNAAVRLRNKYPQINVIISSNIKIADIRYEDIDMAIRSERPTDNGLIIRHLCQTTLGIFASQSYLNRYGIPKKGHAFSGHHLVMYNRKTLPGYWQSLCGESLTQAQIALETDSQSLYIEAICRGLGIGVISIDIVADNHPDLIQILPTCTETKDIWLVVHPQMHPDPRIQALIDIIVSEFENKITSK
ncbi:LysR family transcriptional regulator [Celerinatantimonas sp. YJH-8]|uniref:LysR family transcriptional regulator n=1 Tax=Celerinatantimonas sp. YJH-8 TaxID=3228714 RepID=UPI0038C2A5F4